jgi:hypothetical protein
MGKKEGGYTSDGRTEPVSTVYSIYRIPFPTPHRIGANNGTQNAASPYQKRQDNPVKGASGNG